MALVSSLTRPHQDYSNKVLEGNWFEDRFLQAEGTSVDPVLRPYSGPEEPLVGATKGRSSYLSAFVTAPHHDRQSKPNTRQSIPVHYAAGTPYHPITQKQADSAHIHDRLAAHRTPTMLTSVNMGVASLSSATSANQRTQWGLGNTALAKSDYQACEGRWETTNQHFYVDLPAEKRMLKPKYYAAPMDASHHIKSALKHESVVNAETANPSVVPCGRAGARGAISRHPAEPGSVYGTSVYWDEYAEGKVGPKAVSGGVYGPEI